MMPVQRTRMLRAGEKQVVKWTAEGAVKCVCTEYSATFGQTLPVRDMIVSR